MPLSVHCCQGGLTVKSSHLTRALHISYTTGHVSLISRSSEPEDAGHVVLKIACIIGISRFPTAGHGYLVVSVEVSDVARLPPDQISVHRIDRVLLVPIHKDLAPLVIRNELRNSSQRSKFSDSESGDDEETDSEDDELDIPQPCRQSTDTIGSIERGLMHKTLTRETVLPAWPYNSLRKSYLPPRLIPPQVEPRVVGHDNPLASKFEQSVRDLFNGQTYYSRHPSFSRPKYIFNGHISQEIPEIFRMPVIQGFIGTASLPLDEEISLEMILVSMKSSLRNGLRYQRRGIDHLGHVANFVETNQITWLSSDTSSVASFTQIRGSIPLFWNQDSHSLHPVPVLTNNRQATEAATRMHYEELEKDYGAVVSLSLIDQHGREAIVGQEFTSSMENIHQRIVNWDFHKETAGMKYEQISSLLKVLAPTLIENHWNIDSTIAPAEGNSDQSNRQNGVIRTNCMDCLDRTNVVQSSIALYVLKAQYMSAATDTSEQMPSWSSLCQSRFQTLWADNGDAIAVQYTKSPALKGDFTRTGKREFRGLLNDARNSLKRYYTNFIADHFGQLVIDYILGVVDDEALDKFQATLTPYEQEADFTKAGLREHALGVTQEAILGARNSENAKACLGAWTLLSPSSKSDLSSKLKECQLLLTGEAAYICRFDYNIEKPADSERVSLAHIKKITHGAFVTSTVHAFFTDPLQNYGLVIFYEHDAIERMCAFKSNQLGIKTTQRAFVEEVVRELEAAINKVRGTTAGPIEIVEDKVIFDASQLGGLSATMDVVKHKIRTMIWS